MAWNERQAKRMPMNNEGGRDVEWAHAPPLTAAPAIRAVRLTAAPRSVQCGADPEEEIYC
jgi:hypothetical protein